MNSTWEQMANLERENAVLKARVAELEAALRRLLTVNELHDVTPEDVIVEAYNEALRVLGKRF